MSSEDTPTGLAAAVDLRWDNHQEDREVYDMVFDEAMLLVNQDQRALGSLLMQIINSWEMNRRWVPIQVIAATMTYAEELKTKREAAIDVGLEVLLEEESESS